MIAVHYAAVLLLASVLPAHLVASNNDDLHKLIQNNARYELPRLFGTKLGFSEPLPIFKHELATINNLPEEFDSRIKWPICKSLNKIRDQGCCGSCWAVAAVAAMTDRICIRTNGAHQPYLSAQDLVSCMDGKGCWGESTIDVGWNFWESDGLVTGGEYLSAEGCMPYEIHGQPCTSGTYTPPCHETCRKEYNVSYEKDKHFGGELHHFATVEDIMAEVYTNGPVEAAFTVYVDFKPFFEANPKGVYDVKTSDSEGGHAVKIVGWGVQEGEPYWLIANSWGVGWADNGFFRMKRGANVADIETYVVAAEPVFKPHQAPDF